MSQPTDWRNKPDPQALLEATPEQQALAWMGLQVFLAARARIEAKIRLNWAQAIPKQSTSEYQDEVLEPACDP